MLNNLKTNIVSNNISCLNVSANNHTNKIVACDLFDINAEIDNYSQGKIGDCWLLSGLSAVNNSENGKVLLQNSITQNEDGSYCVEFKGVNIKCTISQDEMIEARENGIYSTGDDDVLLMELAFEKAFLEMKKNPDKYPPFEYDLIDIDEKEDHILDGGNFSYVTYMLTGERSHGIRGDRCDRLLEKFEKNPDDYSICVSFDCDDENAFSVKDVNGNDVKLRNKDAAHTWALLCVDGDTVTLVNPWDTSEEVVLYKDDFMDVATELYFHDY